MSTTNPNGKPLTPVSKPAAAKPAANVSDKIADATVQNAAALPPDIAALVERAIERGLAQGIALGAMQAQTAMPLQPQPKLQNVISGERCPDCQQLVAACKGRHKEMVVYPSNPNHGQFFQGFKLNGITYLSNNSQHRILVPEDASIEYAIQEFEKNEDQMLTGRRREHDSGSIGRGAQGFVPTNQYFR